MVLGVVMVFFFYFRMLVPFLSHSKKVGSTADGKKNMSAPLLLQALQAEEV